jgi:tetratricopeptide (TPR) repeat protein
MGREKEGLAEFQRAIDLDPRSVRFNATLGRLLFSMHQDDRAIDQLHHALDLDPLELDLNSMFARDWLGYVYERKGMYKEAIAEWSKALTLGHEDEQAQLLADAYRASGFDLAVRSLWRKKLEQLKEKTKRGEYVSPEKYATAYSRIGDKEQALDWIGRALQERNGFSTYVNDDPTFDSLRNDQRFKILLQSVVFKQ